MFEICAVLGARSERLRQYGHLARRALPRLRRRRRPARPGGARRRRGGGHPRRDPHPARRARDPRPGDPRRCSCVDDDDPERLADLWPRLPGAARRGRAGARRDRRRGARRGPRSSRTTRSRCSPSSTRSASSRGADGRGRVGVSMCRSPRPVAARRPRLRGVRVRRPRVAQPHVRAPVPACGSAISTGAPPAALHDGARRLQAGGDRRLDRRHPDLVGAEVPGEREVVDVRAGGVRAPDVGARLVDEQLGVRVRLVAGSLPVDVAATRPTPRPGRSRRYSRELADDREAVVVGAGARERRTGPTPTARARCARRSRHAAPGLGDVGEREREPGVEQADRLGRDVPQLAGEEDVHDRDPLAAQARRAPPAPAAPRRSAARARPCAPAPTAPPAGPRAPARRPPRSGRCRCRPMSRRACVERVSPAG